MNDAREELRKQLYKTAVQKLLDLGLQPDDIHCSGNVHCVNCKYQKYIVGARCPVYEKDLLELEQK